MELRGSIQDTKHKSTNMDVSVLFAMSEFGEQPDFTRTNKENQRKNRSAIATRNNVHYTYNK